MNDVITILADSAEETAKAGASLAATLYGLPVTITLRGEIGAGKTTFLQGFARALGVTSPLTSPTYALEQRYPSDRGELIHIDLYRLSDAQASELLHSTDHHSGIRCVEWAERMDLKALERSHACIHLTFSEEKNGRRIDCAFADTAIPSIEDSERWRKDALLPAHIISHCDAVADLCDAFTKKLQKEGRFVRPTALCRAAEIHDLFRFLDFAPGAGPEGTQESPEQQKTWQDIRASYPGKRHEEAAAAFLRQKGFSAIADIVETHGLNVRPSARKTVEQKLLFYADKRVLLDRIVTLEERFDDFAKRYGKGKQSPEGRQWYEESKKTEEELFPEKSTSTKS